MNIPSELHTHLFSFLEFDDIIKTQTVSKRWRDLSLKCNYKGYCLTNVSKDIYPLEKRLSVERKVKRFLDLGKDVTYMNSTIYGDEKVKDDDIEKLLTEIKVDIKNFESKTQYIWQISSDNHYIAMVYHNSDPGRVKITTINHDVISNDIPFDIHDSNNIEILYPHLLVVGYTSAQIWRFGKDEPSQLLATICKDEKKSQSDPIIDRNKYRLTKDYVYMRNHKEFKIFDYQGNLVQQININDNVCSSHWSYIFDDTFTKIYDPIQDDLSKIVAYEFKEPNTFTDIMKNSKNNSVMLMKKYNIIISSDGPHMFACDMKTWNQLWKVDMDYPYIAYDYNPIHPHIFVCNMDPRSGYSYAQIINIFTGKTLENQRDSFGELYLDYAMGNHAIGGSGYFGTMDHINAQQNTCNGGVIPFKLLSMGNGRIVCHNVVQANGIVVYDFN